MTVPILSNVSLVFLTSPKMHTILYIIIVLWHGSNKIIFFLLGSSFKRDLLKLEKTRVIDLIKHVIFIEN